MKINTVNWSSRSYPEHMYTVLSYC